MMDRGPRCYMPSFVEIGPRVPEKKILKGFYHIWAWRPSWLFDPDAVNKHTSPIFYQVITRDQYVCMLLICLLVKAIRTIREMITKRTAVAARCLYTTGFT